MRQHLGTPDKMTVAATIVRTPEQKHTRAGVITAREIQAATSAAVATRSDVWLTDPGARGQGRFTIRCTASGALVCMFRHTRTDGTREILKVGDYDPRGGARHDFAGGARKGRRVCQTRRGRQ